MKGIFRTKVFYVTILAVMLIVGLAIKYYDHEEPKEALTEAEFYTALEAGNVSSLKLEPKKSVYEISGRLRGHGKDQYFQAIVPISEHALDTINRVVGEQEINQIVVIPPDTEVSEWVTFITTTTPFILLLIMSFVIFLLVLVIKRWNRPGW
ncbi:hypothetical protein GW626_17785 [Peribacillus muralis]|uniref:hypothetical protein n=1 Tax=Peribacillus muralis TaxID=264697 RepID=UPI001F4DD30C|nr:hypothetical protein [Peribacillus muralis]MCK1992207.1 hypothetical protein [Peribacillus muralis]MCK2012763.1 hypothetical protein [Peribacillus muralis]